MMRTLPLCFTLLMLPVISSSMDVLVYDHFDDGALDPAWNVTFEDAYGWTSNESGTHLTATDIDPVIINHGSGGRWAIVNLSQEFQQLDPFHLDFDFSWDSEGSNCAMQYLYVSICSDSGGIVAKVGYNDAWIGRRGQINAQIGGTFYHSDNTMPFSGNAAVTIERINSTIAVCWDGDEILTGVHTSPVAQVKMSFGYYAYDGGGGLSFFGSESVDQIRVEGVGLLSVSNVQAQQREGTMLVDVTYDLIHPDGDIMTISLWVSEDGGQTFPIRCLTVSGDVGPGVTSGTGKQIVWYAGVDYPEHVGDDFIVQVIADDVQ